MLRNADYIYNNVIIADGINTTKEYCKRAQIGVDLSVRNLYHIDTPGTVLNDRTIASDYKRIVPQPIPGPGGSGRVHYGWQLHKGTYICELNEGCNFGPNDTGLIYLRSSLNRCGVSIQSAVWDPGYTSERDGIVGTMSVRLTVDTPEGFYLEANSRVAQLLVLQNEDTSLYDGQWQGGRNKSRIKEQPEELVYER